MQTKLTKKDKANLIKKYLVFFAIIFPVLVAINIPMQNKVEDFWVVAIDVVVGLLLFVLLNIVAEKIFIYRDKKRKEILEKKRLDATKRSSERVKQLENERKEKNDDVIEISEDKIEISR